MQTVKPDLLNSLWQLTTKGGKRPHSIRKWLNTDARRGRKGCKRKGGQGRKGRECCLFWQQDVRSSNSRSHLCVIVWAGAVKFSALTFSSVTQEDKLCLILASSPLTCLWGSSGDAQTGIMALYKIIYKIRNIYKILCYFIDFHVEISCMGTICGLLDFLAQLKWEPPQKALFCRWNTW